MSDGPWKRVVVTHSFTVLEGLTDDELGALIGTMTVQVEEPVVGYDDPMCMNEVTTEVRNIEVTHTVTPIVGPIVDSPAYKPTAEEYAEALAQAKREILNDMGTAVSSRGEPMPLTVKSFVELQDYVDANEYGGMCAERWHWWSGSADGGLDTTHRLQDDINAWLESGDAYVDKVATWLYEQYTENRFADWDDLDDDGTDDESGRTGKFPWRRDARRLVEAINPAWRI